MPEYRKPPCYVGKENRIGRGGNGIVGIIPNTNPEIVVKLFMVGRNTSENSKNKRYFRFCKEIKVQNELSNEIKGIIPIYDFSFPEKFDARKIAWYTMPMAEKFHVRDNISLFEKLQRMKELALIIQELHKRGKAHRDIKPDNILLYNGRIYLADFGLVWSYGDNTITNPAERMGPAKIMPPELEEREELNNCDYTKSDVYLFAKVMWMYLKQNEYGYRGEYSRSDPLRAIKRGKDYGETIEPLHQLMEQCSRHNWIERPTIEECIKMLDCQMMVLTRCLDEKEIKRYVMAERTAYFRAVNKPYIEVHLDGEVILIYLKEVTGCISISVKVMGGVQNITPYNVRIIGENLFLLSEKHSDEFVKKYVLHISKLEFCRDDVQIAIKKLSVEETALAKSKGATTIDEDCVGLLQSL